MEEVLSLVIINFAALLRDVPACGKRQQCDLPASVDSKKDEALLRWLREFMLLYVVGSLRSYVFSAFCCEHIV